MKALKIQALLFYKKGGIPIATTKIIPIHIGKGRSAGTAISNVIDYVENPEKTGNGEYISSYMCDSRTADTEFLLSKRQYKDITGRTQANDIIAYQVRQSFKPGEVTPEEANKIGYEFAQRFLKGNNAFIVCTHIDRHHIHNHIIWNSTNLDCTRKFKNFWNSTRAVRQLSDTICVEHGLSIIENPQKKGMNYGEWLGDDRKLSHRDKLRLLIDELLAKNPSDFKALLTLLKDNGVEVKKRGNTISIRLGNKGKFARFSSLGDGYSEADLVDVISGKKEHKPKKKDILQDNFRIDLLSRIDDKIQNSTGGYKQWASVFKAKQLAKTMSYLQEHKLVDFNELTAKCDEVASRYNTLSAQIKSAESRMAEIEVLKKQILIYHKTKEVFAGYKSSKYSKKYLAEHEADILLHRAAKKTFNDYGLKKLPTVKSLQEEFAKLLTDKKAAYPELKKARDEMKELLTVKANVERMLGGDEREKEKEKEQTTDK